MPRRILERRLVCSECGQPIIRESLTTADAEELATVPEDAALDDEELPIDSDGPVDAVIEVGPVCARCAALR